MTKEDKIFNKQLELDVLVNGLSEITQDYVYKHNRDNLTEVVIPEGVKSIGRCAFSYCRKLKKVTISEGVTNIGEYAFGACCYLLTSITIPNTVTNIGDGAFYNCCGLTHIDIPDSVTYIGKYAFDGCPKLPEEYFSEKYKEYLKNCEKLCQTT